jgi:hypothetical protein
MTIKFVRAKVNRGYESISRDMLQHAALSLKARGLLALLLSLPDDWECHGIRGIVKNFCERDGVEAVQNAMQELEKHGYLARRKGRNADGTWQWLWTYGAHPAEVAQAMENLQVSSTSGFPVYGEPGSGEPVSGKPVYGEPVHLEKSLQDLDKRDLQETSADALAARACADAGEPDALTVEAIKAERRRKRAARSPQALSQTAHLPAARPLLEAFEATLPNRLPPVVRGRWLCSISELIKLDYPAEKIQSALEECAEKGLGPLLLAEVASRTANQRPKPSRAESWQQNITNSQQWFDEHGNWKQENPSPMGRTVINVDPIELPPSTG